MAILGGKGTPKMGSRYQLHISCHGSETCINHERTVETQNVVPNVPQDTTKVCTVWGDGRGVQYTAVTGRACTREDPTEFGLSIAHVIWPPAAAMLV